MVVTAITNLATPPAPKRWLPWMLALMALAGLIAVTVALVGNGLDATRERERAAERQIHTYKVLLETQQLSALLQQAETSQRGYIITQDAAYLEPYSRAIASVPRQIAELQRLTSDNARQQGHLAAMAQLGDARLDQMRESVALVRAGYGDRAEAFVRGGRGLVTMRLLSGLIDNVNAEERRLLVIRNRVADDARSNAERAVLFLAVAGAVLLLAAAAGGALGVRSSTRAATLAQSRTLLEDLVNERTRDLQATNDALAAEVATRHAAEGQVRQMQKMEGLGQLTGGIAHDFNNMLAIIIGSLDIAKRRFESQPDRALVCIDNALDGATRAATLTQRMLAFSRQQPLAPQPLDANKLVSGMSDLLQRSLGETVKLETVLAGGLWRTFADPAQVESALLNLAVNARDAMPDGGKLTIETANGHLDDAYAASNAEVSAGQYVLVCVSDSGTGIGDNVVYKPN